MRISLANTALMLLVKCLLFQGQLLYSKKGFNYICQYDISRLSKPAKAVVLNWWSADPGAL